MPIVRPENRRVGFLGYGMMAKAPALVLKSLGFQVSAWVRSPQARTRKCRSSTARISSQPFLAQTDIAVCLLPLTPRDRGHILRPHLRHDAERGHAHERRARQARGGRRSDPALDSGQLAYAALDALLPEPLPPESPLWLHPKVTVMPHVARRPTVATARDRRSRRIFEASRRVAGCCRRSTWRGAIEGRLTPNRSCPIRPAQRAQVLVCRAVS